MMVEALGEGDLRLEKRHRAGVVRSANDEHEAIALTAPAMGSLRANFDDAVLEADRSAHGWVMSSGTTAASNCSALRKPKLECRLAQCRALLVGLFGDLGGLVVADDRIERGDEHERVVQVVVDLFVVGSSPSTQNSRNRRTRRSAGQSSYRSCG